jgi:omega-amidase
MKIGILQLELQDKQPHNNLKKVINALDEIRQSQPDISVLPELWPSALGLKEAQKFAAINQQEIFPEVQGYVKQHGIWLHAGSMLWQDGDKITNRVFIFNPQGEVVLQYDKLHLFTLMNEDKYIDAGTISDIVPFTEINIASGVCYDLRFPELFRKYRNHQADIVFLPAQWPYPRLTHWQILLRARAIENQIFVVACNRTGKAEKYHFFGHSSIIDPWGEVIFEAPEGEVLAVVDIDLSSISEARTRLNAFADVRADIFNLQ